MRLDPSLLTPGMNTSVSRRKDGPYERPALSISL
jgi:hypothetical protein